MTTVLKTFRFDEEVLQKFKDISVRRGDLSWHVNEAMRQYKLINKKEAKVREVVKVRDFGSEEVLDYLNRRAGTKFKNTDNNRKLIEPRIKEFSVQDCKTVIDKKCEEWLNTDMAKYIRPATLFQASKFEGYLNQIPAVNKDAQRERELDGWMFGNDNQQGETIDHEPF